MLQTTIHDLHADFYNRRIEEFRNFSKIQLYMEWCSSHFEHLMNISCRTIVTQKCL